MMRKSKGRQKTKMVKMEKENNLQVTFSKRKIGLFKKASELCTLCDAHVAVIVFSPSGKVYSFGHLDVETIIDRFQNVDHLPLIPQPNMHLDEIPPNDPIQDLNNELTEVMNNLELEQKKTEELKKRRENSKIPEIWLKESIGGLDLGQAKEFKGKLGILKEQLKHEAFKILQGSYLHPSFYVGSSSNSLFGVDGGINFNPNMSLFDQRTMLNVNNFYNHNMALPNHPSPFGNYSHAEGIFPGYNYIPEPNQNENQNPSSRKENEAGDEHHHDGHPPHPRSD